LTPRGTPGQGLRCQHGQRGTPELEFTVDDEDVFTTPWTATITYAVPLGRWEEHVCAESRRGYFSNGEEAQVPTSEKVDF
jgi:hypothetical protein